MRVESRLFRIGLWLATTSLSMGSLAPAWAQPAAPDEPAPAAAGDPPALAGRLSAVSGTVSTHAAGQTEWSPAAVNTPVTTGDSFWTQPQSSATVEIGADHFVMNEATELDIAQLDQTQFVATEDQGEVFLSLPELPQGQSFTVNTPRGAVQIGATGQYDIIAGDSANPTVILVLSGSAQVSGSGVNLTVGANQQATITGTDTLQGGVGPGQPDAFVQAQLRVSAPPPLPAAVPPQVRYMTGGADLAAYGEWQATPDYGQVWYPRNVGADWAPYREGRWSYVAPWGWTWVDDAPWGFAPFHYGRWVSYGGRWGWVAAAPDAPRDDYPVYAPALVGFVGLGGAALAGISIGFGAGFLAGGGVGWVPLGFREPYRPWYHASDRYFQNVNRVSVVNVRNITINNYRNVTINHYANARGATIVPAGAMTRGERLRGIARPLPEAALARATPVVGRLPVRPTAQTPGLTRAEARRYNVALPARPAGPRAPGPMVPQGRPGNRPALRPAGPVHSGGPARPGAPEPGINPPAGPADLRRGGLPPLRPADQVRTRPPALPVPGARRGPGEAPGAPRTPQTQTHPGAAPFARPGVPPVAGPAAPEAPRRNLPDRPTPTPRPQLPRQVPQAAQRREPQAAPRRELQPRPAQPRMTQPRPEPRRGPEFHPAPRPAPQFHAPQFHAPRPEPAPRPAPRPQPPHPEGKHLK